MAGVVSVVNDPSGRFGTVVRTFVDDRICTCELCGRVYRYDYRRGHTQRRCNSCKSNLLRHTKRHKARLVDLKGGACELCGYNKCLPALTFHHLDPATKRFNLGNGHTRSWASLLSEVKRCVLVRQNCHKEVECGVAEILRRIRSRVERALQGVERRERRPPGRPALP